MALSALTLLMGGLARVPLAMVLDSGATGLWRGTGSRGRVGADVAVLVARYVAFFQLQRFGGPVAPSLLGPVAAVTGAGGAL